ncbi:MAG: hypothetical protein Fur0018_09700 [Anaerolineales bacterium]
MSLDDFRNDAFIFDDEEPASSPQDEAPKAGLQFEYAEPLAEAPRLGRKRRAAGGRFLGMTAPQRFLLSALLFVEVCVLGMFVLIATGRMVPPGMY